MYINLNKDRRKEKEIIPDIAANLFPFSNVGAIIPFPLPAVDNFELHENLSQVFSILEIMSVSGTVFQYWGKGLGIFGLRRYCLHCR